MSPTVSQNISMVFEVGTAIKLIKKGIEELNKLDASNDFYHLPVLLLSSGTERLLKCILLLDCLEQDGEYKSRYIDDFEGSKGHDIKWFLSEVIKIGNESKSLKSRPATKLDLHYLKHDKELKKLTRLFTEFGMGKRYWDLNNILDKNKQGDYDPGQGFNEVKRDFIQFLDLDDDMPLEKSLPLIYKEIAISIEKITRALCRFFTLGDLGDGAKVYTGVINEFLFLKDDDLGKMEYLN